MNSSLNGLRSEIKTCQVCLPYLKEGVNPVFSFHEQSKIAIIGQAPGLAVHKSGIPWDDKSGERLRQWMDVGKSEFYKQEIFAIVPMGFCYPGKGKSGDLAPRKECAPLWHAQIFNQLSNLKLILLIGAYAQSYYLKESKKETLTETVRSYQNYLPKFFPLPHPSPRNNIWLKKNEWFEKFLLPEFQECIRNAMRN